MRTRSGRLVDAMNSHPALTPKNVALAREEFRAGGGTVLDALLRHGKSDAAGLLARLEECTGIAPIDSAGVDGPDFDRWRPEAVRAWNCVVLKNRDGTHVAAAADPWALPLQRELDLCVGTEVPLRAATALQLNRWTSDANEQTIAGSGSEDSGATGPIVSFVDGAVQRAIHQGVSDVHFECDRGGVTVKHRLDGVMHRFARMDGVESAEAVISRIKVLAKLDITERRLPQDGRYRHEGAGGAMDIRVSIMPSVHGEDAVLRLLDKSQFRRTTQGISLEALGLERDRVAAIRELATQPSGMLLVTGPTGSGKTTTLYAVLSEINSGLEKIITIEDPVEYELEGVLQIPVNERKGLTFANGLRSILRHDPDRILVGEIRDAETAEIAVQASLTGHQVFTTVHANSVSDIMGRFIHFGIDMFGFMSALNGIVVQRLLRRLCEHCKTSRDLTQLDTNVYLRRSLSVPSRLWRPVGCHRCGDTGYAGRFVISELHRVDDRLRDLVTSRASLTAINQHAVDLGIQTLHDVGLMKCAAGATTLEELTRVVGSIQIG